MSLMRLIQESDVIKKSTMFSLKPYACEVESLKQIIKEKDVLIENHTEKIKELENRVADLETSLEEQSQKSLLEQKQLEDEVSKEEKCFSKEECSQMETLIHRYEKFIAEITSSYEIMKQQRDMANSHLACLECSFADLVEKYERLKHIVSGYQENQAVLLEHIDTYKNAMQLLQNRYEDFKNYADTKLNEANLHIEKNDKRHISDMAKVKSQMLQSKVKINELEKALAIMSSNTHSGDTLDNSSNKKLSFLPLLNKIN